MEGITIVKGDQYHCNCFSIDTRYIASLRQQLLNEGYFVPMHEDHGQVFGLAKNLDNTMQFHIKVMPNGRIEAEIEPRTDYLEHLNQQYSSPGHHYVKELLDRYRIPHGKHFHSLACMFGTIKKPETTTSVAGIVGGFFASIVILGLLNALFSEE